MAYSRPGIACIAFGFALALLGCRKTTVARLSALDPSERAAAIVALSEAGDPEAVHKLVDLLEDRDRGVRMYANLALLKLCGEDYGYRYHDPEPLRAQAVDRWRDALRDGRVSILPAAARSAPRISAHPGSDVAPPGAGAQPDNTARPASP